ncbi:Mrp/NBP35 family ATP-binding protein [Rothia kristinae]|uniref:Mrp/NBP35 family ATP-binding protein n=1 Tax=Rothia kristinae TaxID=37923 RepID=UPI001CD758FF|nr:P-loop NTPase [Rothia kristinae]MCA1169665.1 Mrp/NBP35 family ATP-binding protein [Rothia kristinae]MCT1357182.1 Mrp/NBP35 family ATP-binding protein [Rothia kristinae]MCT1392651.1 Mrp/NBP35 family ATP-binding protein [Rothia kristinae]MCT1505849.1 Mrp/NBP35 family ATP-binding protein [Rothia kristinae]MCT2038443.1 Mrp/NBP35 family ATP-binding protein [Rothia kristinae]
MSPAVEDLDAALGRALARVIDPELRRPITELGMVDSAVVREGRAEVSVLLTVQGCPLRGTIEQDVREAALTVAGIDDVAVSVGYMSPEQRQRLRERLGHTRTNPFAQPDSLTQVYAVASGKGGVGKSTVTVNLAAALASQGRSVGIVDADVHGFSVPGLLGITQAPTKLEDMILPPVVEVPHRTREDPSEGSVRVISIGMFVDGNRPIAWRGPMLHRALEQFLTDVHFGDLDVLLLDLPPGTGDIAISMAQLLPTARLLLVSTPQQAAVEVAERAGTLSLQTGQEVIGVVENMAAMLLPDGSTMELFGAGGGQRLAGRLTEDLGYDVPLLGSVPLDLALREGGDAGTPVVWSAPESPAGCALRRIGQALGSRGRDLPGRSLPLNL